MPFDRTTCHQPAPQPPQPPERSGGPRRIRIEIETVQRPQLAQRHFCWFGTLTLTLLAIALLAALAGCAAAPAQPSSWQSYREGFMTMHQGTDADGGQRTGQSYRQGFTTYFDANGPHGEQQHCRSWQQGWQTFTECN